MRSVITYMQTQAKRELQRSKRSLTRRFISASGTLHLSLSLRRFPYLLSPCRALSFPFHLHFSLSEDDPHLHPFKRRRCHTHCGGVTDQGSRDQEPVQCTGVLSSIQICIVSSMHNLRTTLCTTHLAGCTPAHRESAATSCVYITHHLLHQPIRSQRGEADLEST